MLSHRVAFATLAGAMLCLASSEMQAQRIDMPVGYRLTWIGARWNVGAKVVDQAGRATATPLAYRMADPSVASVNSRGEVVARKPGSTRVWAVAGRDSASALVMVEQWPARFTFSPAGVRFDALGARQQIRVLASDSAGVPIVGSSSRISACRSTNDRVASVSGGEILSVSNGSAWIRCSERGLADSVRVDVQQRPTSAAISNKGQLARRQVGDTFSINVSAKDRLERQVVDVRATWASLSPSVVSVDPLTGRARAVNGGPAKIIVQVGDIRDSTTIAVEGEALYTAPVAVAVTPDSTPRTRAAIVSQGLFPQENDTTYISVTVTDTAGRPVSLNDVRMRIVDTTVAIRVDSTRIFARRTGQTQLIASYGSMVDTIGINVRSRPVGNAGAADSGSAASRFESPPTYADSVQVYQVRRDSTLAAIRENRLAGGATDKFVFTPMAVGAIVEHLTRTDAGIIEDRTGPLYGGGASLLLYQRLEVLGTLRLGTLTSIETVGEDLTLTEVEGSVGLFPVRQLGLRGGVVMRGERTQIATQTWFIPKVSLVTRFSFIGDVVSTYAVFSVLPRAKFSGIEESGSLLSRGGEAGLDFRRNVVNAGLTYYVEQLSFDESPRTESFSAIRLRFGLNFGR